MIIVSIFVMSVYIKKHQNSIENVSNKFSYLDFAKSINIKSTSV